MERNLVGPGLVLGALLVLDSCAVVLLSEVSQTGLLQFSCEVFTPTTSAADLAARFGTANVRTAPVPWGGAEGDFSEGTVLFGETPDAKLEIYWRDTPNKREPGWVSVRGKRTRWRTTAGITLGTPLRTIEQLNRKSFRVLGFGSDGSGSVMSWSAGRLDSQNVTNCRVRMRVGPNRDRPDARTRALTQKLEGGPYSSGHPAMQELNPSVHEMLITYDRSGQ